MTTDKKVVVQLVRSPIGCAESHRATVRGLGLRTNCTTTFLSVVASPNPATVRGLGLRKMRSTSELVDTPEVRGMINKISYLVKVL